MPENTSAESSRQEVGFSYCVEYPKKLSEDEAIWPVRRRTEEEKDKPIVIVLLGWAGSEHKYLSKYSDFYLEKGCIILRIITSVNVTFWDTGKLPIFAGQFVILLRNLNLSGHPIFFHSFSNGGSFLYSNILRELAVADNNKLFDVRGTMFDSAPAPREISSLFRVLATVFSTRVPGLNYVIASAVTGLVLVHTYFVGFKSIIWSLFTGGNRGLPKGHLHNWLKRISNVRNHRFLFLYSEEDPLVASYHIEKCGHMLKDRGNLVRLHKFQGSLHVQHFRQHPEEYKEVVTEFVRSAMEGKKKDNDGRMILWDEEKSK